MEGTIKNGTELFVGTDEGEVLKINFDSKES